MASSLYSTLYTHTCMCTYNKYIYASRAFGRTGDFKSEFKNRLDTNTRAYFSFLSVTRWFGFQLDAIVVVLLVVSTFGAVLSIDYNIVSNPESLSVGVM